MRAYRVKDWAKNFEKSDLKKTITWTWMPFPLKHDGKGFRRIAESSGNVRILSGWILMAEIAAKMPERGLLVDEDGPFTPEDMRLKTGFPAEVFEDALKFLCDKKIGWMEEGEWDSVSGWHPDTSGQHPDTSGLHDTIGEERRGEDIPAAAASGRVRTKRPKAEPKAREPDPIWDEVAAQWFGGDVARPSASRVGAVVRDLKDLGATPDEIRARIARHKTKWPTVTCSPESLVKNWALFAATPPPAALPAPEPGPIFTPATDADAALVDWDAGDPKAGPKL